ncbi:hypothetical protein FACS189481_1720 [Clostridia bacterium]|nr:hypothetical protein FACS189481_1720 [Clostridia bacterium]
MSTTGVAGATIGISETPDVVRVGETGGEDCCEEISDNGNDIRRWVIGCVTSVAVGLWEAGDAPLSAAVGVWLTANSAGFLPWRLNVLELPEANLTANGNAAQGTPAGVGCAVVLPAWEGGDNEFTARCARPPGNDNE